MIIESRCVSIGLPLLSWDFILQFYYIEGDVKPRLRGWNISCIFFCTEGLTKLVHCLIYTNDSSQRVQIQAKYQPGNGSIITSVCGL